MSYPPSRYAKKVIHLPSGDQVGCRASLKRSVIRVAAPPVAGSVQMLPCRSTASVRPSGETPTDIDVPSWTVTSIRAGPGAGTLLSATTRTSTPIAIHLRPMAALQRGWGLGAGSSCLGRALPEECRAPESWQAISHSGHEGLLDLSREAVRRARILCAFSRGAR